MLEDKEESRTPIGQLGEFGLIEKLTKDLSYKRKSTLKGVGDDAAVMQYGDKILVFTTDMLVEGVHFDLSYVPLKHLGYKSVIVNISDVYAMNAEPEQITVSLALSNRFPVEAVEEIYEGMRLACEMYDVDLVGGDTTSSKSGLIISISAVGSAGKPEDIVYRSGAKTNELLAVSGDLGAAYMGLQLLEREKQVYLADPNMQPDLQGHEYILERQLKPEARRDIIKLFRELDVQPSAMMDISDGLSSEILHICEASGLGCKLFEDKIPIDPAMVTMAEEFRIDPVTAALNGGEDYELLFTLPLEAYEKIKDRPEIKVIGHMVSDTKVRHLVTPDEKFIELKAQGWDAAKKE